MQKLVFRDHFVSLCTVMPAYITEAAQSQFQMKLISIKPFQSRQADGKRTAFKSLWCIPYLPDRRKYLFSRGALWERIIVAIRLTVNYSNLPSECQRPRKKHLLPWICWASKYPGVIGFLQVFYHCNFSEFYTAKSKWLNSSSAFRTSEEITLDYRKFLEQADIIYYGYNKLTWSNLLREIRLRSKHSSKVVQAFNCGDFFKVFIIQVVHSFFLNCDSHGQGNHFFLSFNNNFQSSYQSVVWRTPGVCGL